jgi:hypothetical protein
LLLLQEESDGADALRYTFARACTFKFFKTE